MKKTIFKVFFRFYLKMTRHRVLCSSHVSPSAILNLFDRNQIPIWLFLCPSPSVNVESIRKVFQFIQVSKSTHHLRDTKRKRIRSALDNSIFVFSLLWAGLWAKQMFSINRIGRKEVCNHLIDTRLTTVFCVRNAHTFAIRSERPAMKWTADTILSLTTFDGSSVSKIGAQMWTKSVQANHLLVAIAKEHYLVSTNDRFDRFG